MHLGICADNTQSNGATIRTDNAGEGIERQLDVVDVTTGPGRGLRDATIGGIQ
jgi:hypothetical protein